MTIPTDKDPIDLFLSWFEDARRAKIEEPTAMALATADAKGRPSVRMVLMKDVNQKGFVFYTNKESRKGAELGKNKNAALCFYWSDIDRQVRVWGPVEQVSEEEADAYFASRPRLSQIGAWASHQSHPMKTRFELEKKVAYYTAKFGIKKIPRPPFWVGYRVVPEQIEFWLEKPFRLHERVLFTREGKTWKSQRLFP
jgi:pyridoxamine 5'-phosphate oxidase